MTFGTVQAATRTYVERYSFAGMEDRRLRAARRAIRAPREFERACERELIWSAAMLPDEEMVSHDLMVDEASSTLRMTAHLFERSAAATADKEEREALLDYAKLYREMADLRDHGDAGDAEVDDEPA